MIYSNTYPKDWTEEQRVAAEKALSKEEIAKLRQEWETPPDFWAAVDRIFQFQKDVCGTEVNKKCVRVMTPELNSLREHCMWVGDLAERVWCNPGFSDVLPWHQKAHEESNCHPSCVVVVIGIPGASQEWYRFAQAHADEIIDLSPRVHFLAPWPLKQSSNNRESMLFVYRRKVVPTRPATRTLWRWKGEE